MINQFGKRGCFFQFISYNDCPSAPNVDLFNVSCAKSGFLQEFDDFENDVEFDNINSYSDKKTRRKKNVYLLPIKKNNSSKSYCLYKVEL